MLHDSHTQKFKHLLKLDNKGVHNFSLGCLDSYFRLNEGIRKYEVSLIYNRILYLHRQKKVFVFESRAEDIEILQTFQKAAVIYSIEPIEGLMKKSKFTEIAYDLKKVFNPESYPNKKKRYNRITYPFTWLDKHEVEVKRDMDCVEVKKLHDTWVYHKLENPDTFRIMFPSARYFYCYTQTNSFEQAVSVDYRKYGFFFKGKLVSVRIVSIQKDTAYDLANFSNTWDAPSQLSNYVDVWVLRDLWRKGITTFNCGATLDKKLKTFKTHYPNHRVISYMYSKIKKLKKEEQNAFFN